MRPFSHTDQSSTTTASSTRSSAAFVASPDQLVDPLYRYSHGSSLATPDSSIDERAAFPSLPPASSSNVYAPANQVGLGIVAPDVSAEDHTVRPSLNQVESSGWAGDAWRRPSDSTTDYESSYAPSEDDEPEDDLFDSPTLRQAYETLVESQARDQEGEAVSTAQKGTGRIVNGEEADLETLDVPDGATHLLISSTTAPHVVPSFLRAVLPAQHASLLVLDISSCELTSLPSEIAQLPRLEELNISSNPFVSPVLPALLAGLAPSLRLLIADDCNAAALPREYARLHRLNTLSLRRNRLMFLPSWLCTLTNLEIMLLDGNPFCGPWQSIVSPILAETVESRSRLSHEVSSAPSTPASATTLPVEPQPFPSPHSTHPSPRSQALVPTLPPGRPPQRSLTRSRAERPSTNVGAPSSSIGSEGGSQQMRKMKSAGDLRSRAGTVSSGYLHAPEPPERFASIGRNHSRITPPDFDELSSSSRAPTPHSASGGSDETPHKNGAQGGRKWGFLKKMSMGRMRSSSNAGTRSTPPPDLPPPLPSTRSALESNHSSPAAFPAHQHEPTSRISKRRSFLPLDAVPMGLGLSSIPLSAPMLGSPIGEEEEQFPSPGLEGQRRQALYSAGFRVIMSYLRDLHDLGAGGEDDEPASHPPSSASRYGSIGSNTRPSMGRSATNSSLASRNPSESSLGVGSSARTTLSESSDERPSVGSNGDAIKHKDDPARREKIVREIIETERTYVRGLAELTEIYVKPSALEVPAVERKIVFNGVESLLTFHRESFLPALENAAASLLLSARPADVSREEFSLEIASQVALVFCKHAAFLKIYSSYINNFDSALLRLTHWSSKDSGSARSSPAMSPSSTQLSSLTISTGSVSPVAMPATPAAASGSPIPAKERKRIRQFLKAARKHPRHAQLNLESYLLLPVQRIPRYRLLLEDLVRCTPPKTDPLAFDPLASGLEQISALANDMNEGKRDAEGRNRLVQWQSRIRGKFPSPLVQPHRRLLLDGGLVLTRVVKRTVAFVEVDSGDGSRGGDEHKSVVQVDCLHQESAQSKPLVGLLCTDLMVLCKDPSRGMDQTSPVDLYAVLRLQNTSHPAVVHGSTLRIVDSRAILYLDCADVSAALTWAQAINNDMSSW